MLMSFGHFSSGHIHPSFSRLGVKIDFHYENHTITVWTASETHSLIYRYEKTRRIISTNLAPNVKQKYVYVLINY